MPRAVIGLESKEKLQIGLDKLFGIGNTWKRVYEGARMRTVKGSPHPGYVSGFTSIREAYTAFTGDPDVSGRLNRDEIHVYEEIDSSTFLNALGDTLGRVLLQSYAEQDYGLDLLVPESNRRTVRDFRTQERIRIGYFDDIDDVDPEAADYAEIGAPTDEKATYSINQKGNLLTITRKTLIDDDLGAIQQMVERLGRSARRTLAQRVFNLMIANGAIYDAITWAHAVSHGGNLTSIALSAAQLDVIRGLMRNQTEKDSDKRLGIGPAILVVPNELEGKAKSENTREFLDSDFTPNPVRFMFGQNSERIIVSPLLTDPTDYYVLADQRQVPCIELGFLQGRQEPEFFLADQPTSERVFTSDKIRYKARHEYECVATDYRGFHKAVVAG